ncbi:hypothetical protein DPEC_G00273220 [Dallia pectoralis]|uniref:Uncharacterized protein n=1 Tax=Dallia pectoralis TaxID=75939 RepID=A0ACC2FQ90_DALPE|nr:hypothetical protein DPEC_G00273220 [Dallia pectoralis]
MCLLDPGEGRDKPGRPEEPEVVRGGGGRRGPLMEGQPIRLAVSPHTPSWMRAVWETRGEAPDDTQLPRPHLPQIIVVSLPAPIPREQVYEALWLPSAVARLLD